ncbi:hypothetical protein [Sphingopyxis terrae]|uniref:hypothetical protein n=1 Tax=Sphingopyxis terrae TaxID=33052 RepID=UPI001C2C7F5B|nr:hypothetical protein [Sphingopyxis terrae]QXF11271.1 hypothetical protein HBA51_03160 [Sphingopyxis terrae subsp. terrae]
MIEAFEIRRPAAEGEIARSHGCVRRVIGLQDHKLGMKAAGAGGYGVDGIFAANTDGAAFLERHAVAERIRQDRDVRDALPKQRLDEHRLGKRRAERIGREGGTAPFVRRDQIELREALHRRFAPKAAIPTA